MSDEVNVAGSEGYETRVVRSGRAMQAKVENELLQKAGADPALVRLEMKLDAAIAAILALQKRVDSIDAALAQIVSR